MDELWKLLKPWLVLMVIGTVITVVGIAGGIKTAPVSIEVRNPGPQTATVLLGVLLLLLGISERRRQDGSESAAKTAAAEGAVVRAEKFLFSLDDKTSAGFEELAAGATRVAVVGRTMVNLLGQNRACFEALLGRGGRVQLLFTDPNSEAGRGLYVDAPELHQQNAATASWHVTQLRKSFPDRVEVKTMSWAPLHSLLIVEKENPADNLIQVQLYFLRSKQGRDRPVFNVRQGDRWFRCFADEFENLWGKGTPWTGS